MGLFWLLLSFALLVIAAGGLVNFPYIPMFFGLYGANAKSRRGRLLGKALAFFPVLVVISLALGWMFSPVLLFVPLAWLLLIWLFRPVNEPELTSRFASEAENCEQLVRSLADELAICEKPQSDQSYFLFRVLCPSRESVDAIVQQSATHNFSGPAEIDVYPSEVVCVLRVTITSTEMKNLQQLIGDIVRVAWRNAAIVSSVSIY